MRKWTEIGLIHSTGIEPSDRRTPPGTVESGDRGRSLASELHFTKPALNALPAARAGTRDYYNDDQASGLQLIVTDRGRKTFYLYAWFRGKPKRFRIGGFPGVTPDRARVIVDKMRGDLAENIDPTAERIRQRTKGVTLRDAFKEFEKVRRKLKARTLRDYKRFLETVFAGWLDQPFIEITRDRIASKHAEITESSGPAHADNAMRSLRSILNFAMVQFEGPDGERPMSENPVAKLSQTRAWNRVQRRTTVIAPHQLKAWFAAVLELKQMAPASQDAKVADYLLFLILTGVRRSEAATLPKDRVDLKARTFTLRDTKNRDDHVLPLSDYLVDLLRVRIKLSGESKFVFPGDGEGGHLVEPRPQMKRVSASSGVSFTLHDLRRTFGTVAESLDIPAYALKRLLNHKMRQDVTAGYLIITPERLREPMQKVSDYFLRAAGIREGAKVVQLGSRRKSEK